MFCKKVFFLLLCSVLAVNAQDDDRKDDDFQTLFNGSLESKTVFYGGPLVEYTKIIGQNALAVGGQLGVIFKGRYGLGLVGKGFTALDSFRGKDGDVEKDMRLSAGVGGISLSYVGNFNRAVHFSIFSNVLAGRGNIYEGKDKSKKDRERIARKTLWGVEPGLGIEFNLTDFFVVNAVVSYRYLTPAEGKLLDFEATDLSGISAGLQFKFGNFGKFNKYMRKLRR